MKCGFEIDVDFAMGYQISVQPSAKDGRWRKGLSPKTSVCSSEVNQGDGCGGKTLESKRSSWIC